jgi:hypothetical protein
MHRPVTRNRVTNNRYYWADQKLSRAVHSLAVGPEDIRGRLPRVYYLLADLSATDFPEALQADFEWVMSKLTARKPRWTGPDVRETPAQASVAAMRSKTAAAIAERIVYLSDRILTVVMTDD